MKLRKTPDELILRGGAFAAAVLCVLCTLRILRTDAAASDSTAADSSAAGSAAYEAPSAALSASPAPSASRSGETPAASRTAVPPRSAAAAAAPASETAPAVSETTSAASETASAAPADPVWDEPEDPDPVPVAADPAVLAPLFAEIPVNNDAGVSYSTDALAEMVPAFEITLDPLVLIVHTHGSEAYIDSEGADDGLRCRDITQNVVQVGDALCRVLNEAGIPAVHDETMYDVPSYTASYNMAAAGIAGDLEKWPSVQIVLDVHRDAYVYPDGHLLRTAQDLAGGRAARVMFLVGTDAGTLEHPTWRRHLAFAMALQVQTEALEPGLMRPINLRKQRFNEHLSPGSLLVEVGASGDTLEEALAGVRIFGKALAAQLRAPGIT